jgi:hypothetical protein
LRFAPYVANGINATTKFFYNFDEGGKTYYTREKDKYSDNMVTEKVELIASSLNLQYLL